MRRDSRDDDERYGYLRQIGAPNERLLKSLGMRRDATGVVVGRRFVLILGVISGAVPMALFLAVDIQHWSWSFATLGLIAIELAIVLVVTPVMTWLSIKFTWPILYRRIRFENDGTPIDDAHE